MKFGSSPEYCFKVIHYIGQYFYLSPLLSSPHLTSPPLLFSPLLFLSSLPSSHGFTPFSPPSPPLLPSSQFSHSLFLPYLSSNKSPPLLMLQVMMVTHNGKTKLYIETILAFKHISIFFFIPLQ